MENGVVEKKRKTDSGVEVGDAQDGKWKWEGGGWLCIGREVGVREV